jgi:hypothetical protein
MLYDGCIEDSNGYYNESYINILSYPYGEDKLTGDYLECKEYLINEFKTNGSYYKSKFSSKVDMVINSGFGGIVASTVVDCSNGEIEIIREGAGSLDDL